VDDGEANIKAAQALGMQTLCPHNNEDWTLFPEIKQLSESI
jgi:FMN phosphatase YigB (HAD superfamily)